MLLIFFVLIGFITNELSSVAKTYGSIVERRLDRRDTNDVVDAVEAAKLYLSISGQLPTSLAQLATFSKSIGKQFDESRVGFRHVPVVTGSLFQYERVIFFIQKRGFATNEADFLAGNTCGIGDDDDAGFCAPDSGYYAVIDTNSFMMDKIRRVNFRMNESYYKITQTYDGRGIGFPNQMYSGAVMAPNSSVTLAQFVGYGGTAAACGGTFKFNVMFLNCSDLFDEFGTPVIYYYKNSREIFLAVQTPYKDASGNSINISRYAKV